MACFLTPSLAKLKIVQKEAVPLRSESQKKESYLLGEPLGEGTFAHAVSGRRQSDDFPVALKISKKLGFAFDSSREIVVHRRISTGHDNIVQLLDTATCSREDLVEGVVPVVELCTISLGSFWETPFARSITVNTLVDMMRQVWNGLSFLHENQLVHNDMSVGNILLDANAGLLKICDFGASISSRGLSATLFQSSARHEVMRVGSIWRTLFIGASNMWLRPHKENCLKALLSCEDGEMQAISRDHAADIELVVDAFYGLSFSTSFKTREKTRPGWWDELKKAKPHLQLIANTALRWAFAHPHQHSVPFSSQHGVKLHGDLAEALFASSLGFRGSEALSCCAVMRDIDSVHTPAMHEECAAFLKEFLAQTKSQDLTA